MILSYFVDMPGFKDTSDWVIDVATAFWIKAISQESKTLKTLP